MSDRGNLYVPVTNTRNHYSLTNHTPPPQTPYGARDAGLLVVNHIVNANTTLNDLLCVYKSSVY